MPEVSPLISQGSVRHYLHFGEFLKYFFLLKIPTSGNPPQNGAYF